MTITIGVYAAAEPSFGVDPGDGALFAPLYLRNPQFPARRPVKEDTNFAIDGDAPTAQQFVQDGAELPFEVSATGYAAAAAGGAPPAADILDLLLASALGEPIVARGGAGVATGSTVGNIILDDADDFEVDELLALYSATANRTRWRHIQSVAGAPTLTVDPAWETAPADADVVYGCRIYGQRRWPGPPGATLALLPRINQVLHRLLGGRPTALRLNQNAAGAAVFSGSLRFNGFESGILKPNLPTITEYVEKAARGERAGVYFNGARISTSTVGVDFGLVAEDDKSTEGVNGRQGITVHRVWPVITLSPLYAPEVWQPALELDTEGPVLLQFGGGALVGGRINSLAFYAPRAQVISVGEQRDGQTLRHQVQLRVNDTGSPVRRRWMLARC